MIFVCLVLNELYPVVVIEVLGKSGFTTALTDIEMITMQIVAESFGLQTKCSGYILKISCWFYFCKHCLNLWWMKQKITAHLTV